MRLRQLLLCRQVWLFLAAQSVLDQLLHMLLLALLPLAALVLPSRPAPAPRHPSILAPIRRSQAQLLRANIFRPLFALLKLCLPAHMSSTRHHSMVIRARRHRTRPV
ncbi:hypothetical protein GGR56DRAFT_640125 [Xylariaceae sp. FL0804]|nr:hypothetical protein GGR56DRAFT_640125 [Xylariaceae sp. FL0804]